MKTVVRERDTERWDRADRGAEGGFREEVMLEEARREGGQAWEGRGGRGGTTALGARGRPAREAGGARSGTALKT